MHRATISGEANLELAIMRAIMDAKNAAMAAGIQSDADLPEEGGFAVDIAYAGNGEWDVQAAFEADATLTIGGDAAPYWRDPRHAAEAIIDWFDEAWVDGYMSAEAEAAERHGSPCGPEAAYNDLAPTIYQYGRRYFAVVRSLAPGVPVREARGIPFEIAQTYGRVRDPNSGVELPNDRDAVERAVGLLQYLGLVSDPGEAPEASAAL